MISFIMLHPEMTAEHLGIIPMFLDEGDPRPAREQIDENYQHGGGWRPINGFKLEGITPLTRNLSPFRMAKHLILQYPEDPPLHPLAVAQFHNETLVFYEMALLAIFADDYSYEVARLD